MPQRADMTLLPSAQTGGGRPGVQRFANSDSERPATDAGSIQAQSQTTMHFGCRKAIGGGRLSVEQLANEGFDLGWPRRMMGAAGSAGLPARGISIGSGAEIVVIELADASFGNAQLNGRFSGTALSLAKALEDVPDEGSPVSVN